MFYMVRLCNYDEGIRHEAFLPTPDQCNKNTRNLIFLGKQKADVVVLYSVL